MNNISGFSNALLTTTQLPTSDPTSGSDPAASGQQSDAFGDVLAGLSQQGDNQQASSRAPNGGGWSALGGDMFPGGSNGSSDQGNSFRAGGSLGEAPPTKNLRKRAHSARTQRNCRYQAGSSQIAKRHRTRPMERR